ncbi:MAG: hypothetical protein D8M58_17340 [Calditrichaeota bacterium]|nr:MAG: hypothetical protein DWQ03_01255 [Calditrichota bacterium]MBL1207173.1 hypothetical protein [Calditrichota bacterium]NOG47005.1 hypothetical protein [Calditrichota bacterium]
MNHLIKISIILLYIVFAQIYPVVHWHAQEHHDDVAFRLSVHPPEVQLDSFDHDDHNDQADEHEHEDTHFDGDSDYTIHAKTTNSIITAKTLKSYVASEIEPQVLSRIPRYIPLKIPSQYLPLSFPNRAPPIFV